MPAASAAAAGGPFAAPRRGRRPSPAVDPWAPPARRSRPRCPQPRGARCGPPARWPTPTPSFETSGAVSAVGRCARRRSGAGTRLAPRARRGVRPAREARDPRGRRSTRRSSPAGDAPTWSLVPPARARRSRSARDVVIIGRRPVADPDFPERAARRRIEDPARSPRRTRGWSCATTRWYITDLDSTNGVLFATLMGTEVEADARRRGRARGERFLLGDAEVRLAAGRDWRRDATPPQRRSRRESGLDRRRRSRRPSRPGAQRRRARRSSRDGRLDDPHGSTHRDPARRDPRRRHGAGRSRRRDRGAVVRAGVRCASAGSGIGLARRPPLPRDEPRTPRPRSRRPTRARTRPPPAVDRGRPAPPGAAVPAGASVDDGGRRRPRRARDRVAGGAVIVRGRGIRRSRSRWPRSRWSSCSAGSRLSPAGSTLV